MLFVLSLVFFLSISIFLVSADDAFGAAIRPGFDSNTFVRNDDLSTIPINLQMREEAMLANPIEPINFFGTNFFQVIINNNGNISFDDEIPTFTPFDLSTSNTKIIAPFFADVDTTFTGMPVKFGKGTVNGRDAFGVSWIDVDCDGVATPDSEIINVPDIPNPSATVFNSFQLILIERFDTGPGNFDIEFNYDKIKWETGEASGGDETCLGGPTAIVGFSDGGANTFQLAGSDEDGAFLDNGPSSLIQNSFNSNTLGRYIFPVRGGEPITDPQQPPVIGGSILPVNSMALLLAYTQDNSYSILTAFALMGTGAIGFLYYISNRRN